MTDASKLKRCPFCGGQAHAEIYEDDHADAWARVGCTACVAETRVPVMWFENGEKELAQASAAWNSRHVAPELVALVDRLRAIVDADERGVAVDVWINCDFASAALAKWEALNNGE